MNELVIDRPDLQPPAMRALYSAMTVALWTFYVYLLLPLATLLAWYVGYSAVYEEMMMRRGWEALVELIGWYSLIVLIMGLIQVGWASINWARFRGARDRRRLRERQVDMEVEKMFLIDTTEFPAWQNARRIVVHHHPVEHKIVSVGVA
jgi:biofilm PGA synthesis protein PgaD